jgi:hypothetical protein
MSLRDNTHLSLIPSTQGCMLESLSLHLVSNIETVIVQQERLAASASSDVHVSKPTLMKLRLQPANLPRRRSNCS